ncbi:Flp family type IVb pilin [Comamonas sp. Tr-654]|uniref:Flp family type IVb pilin n=1 Tax=Comamonas sp. Tr-654 TaxID=2608341 RepID=UPI0019648CB5|nr:Flp family type IVb pilin [Comamonas sp. Tr-654]
MKQTLNSPSLSGAINVTSRIRQFLRDESGVTAIEYGILAAAMAAAVGVIFGADGAFITALREKFKSIASDITSSGSDIKSAK